LFSLIKDDIAAAAAVRNGLGIHFLFSITTPAKLLRISYSLRHAQAKTLVLPCVVTMRSWPGILLATDFHYFDPSAASERDVARTLSYFLYDQWPQIIQIGPVLNEDDALSIARWILLQAKHKKRTADW
jgi:hypothetical protein